MFASFEIGENLACVLCFLASTAFVAFFLYFGSRKGRG